MPHTLRRHIQALVVCVHPCQPQGQDGWSRTSATAFLSHYLHCVAVKMGSQVCRSPDILCIVCKPPTWSTVQVQGFLLTYVSNAKHYADRILLTWLQERLGFVLIIGSAICYCGAIAIIGALYKFWAPHPSCGLNIFFITFTLVLALIYTLVSVSPWRVETAGLLTSGVVFLYCAWLVWSALGSEPDTARCVYMGAKGTTAQKVTYFVSQWASPCTAEPGIL